MNAITKQDGMALTLIEQVVIGGDLSKLTPKDRLAYYAQVCNSVGINPLTKPFDYLNLNGKLVLYANRGATEQLRRVHNVSVEIKSRELVDGCYVVTASATMPAGTVRERHDESIGAVDLGNLKGEARANGMMKAETKAKRRVTLSICGLGMLDETEVVTVPGAKAIRVDSETGEILEPVTSVHKPTDGAEDRIPTSRQQIVADCVVAALDHLNEDRDYDAYEVLAGLTDPDEKVLAWKSFDSKQRRRLKEQAEKARLTLGDHG